MFRFSALVIFLYLYCLGCECSNHLRPTYKYEIFQISCDINHPTLLSVDVYNGFQYTSVYSNNIDTNCTSVYNPDLYIQSSSYYRIREVVHTLIEYETNFCHFIRPDYSVHSFRVLISDQFKQFMDFKKDSSIRLIQSSVGRDMVMIHSTAFSASSIKNNIASFINVLAVDIHGPVVVCSKSILSRALVDAHRNDYGLMALTPPLKPVFYFTF